MLFSYLCAFFDLTYLYSLILYFFFFKQKTAYEMRISDWSSDVCSSDLRTASGKLCLISNSRRSGYGYDQRIEVFCARGLIRAGNVHENTIETWGEDGAASAPLQNFFLDRYAQAYRAEIAHFAEIVEGHTVPLAGRSEEHTSELQSLMRISYAVF